MEESAKDKLKKSFEELQKVLSNAINTAYQAGYTDGGKAAIDILDNEALKWGTDDGKRSR